jgi:hypothetical protein
MAADSGPSGGVENGQKRRQVSFILSPADKSADIMELAGTAASPK